MVTLIYNTSVFVSFGFANNHASRLNFLPIRRPLTAGSTTSRMVAHLLLASLLTMSSQVRTDSRQPLHGHVRLHLGYGCLGARNERIIKLSLEFHQFQIVLIGESIVSRL